MANKKGSSSFSWLPWVIIVVVLVIDFTSKYYTQKYLPLIQKGAVWYPYGGIPVFKDFFGIEFSLVHATNKGAAWGLGASYQLPLMILRGCLIAGLLIYVCFFNKNKSYQIPLALIIAGAIGNVIDYFLYGHVIDMFHFVLWGYQYPVFNVADSAIFLGIVSLLLLSFKKK